MNSLPAHVTWMLRAVSAGLGVKLDSLHPKPMVPLQQWPELLAFVTWHRCAPAVLEGIRRDAVAPGPPLWNERLREIVDDGTRRNLLLCRHLLELTDGFSKAGVPFLTLKGLSLSQQIFGNLGFRLGRDIDLLISPKDYAAVTALLRSMGYQPKQPQIPYPPPLRWQYTSGEIWFKDQTLIDLHCSLDEPGAPFPLTVEHAFSHHAGTVSIGGRSIPVLEPQVLMLYLANHAAKHLWMRFFWLADLVGLSHETKGINWDRVLGLAKQMGMERRLWMTLRLASDVFTWPLPPGVKPLEKSLGNLHTWCETWQGFALERREYAKSLVLQIPPARVYRWSLRLTDKPIQRWKLAGAWFFRPLGADVLSLRLPARLRFLYRLWRPWRLLARSVGLFRKSKAIPDSSRSD